MRILIVLILASFTQCCGQSARTNDSKNNEQNMAMNIHKAVEKNDVKLLNELLQQQGNIEVKDEKGRTPLMRAVYDNNFDAAKALVLAGANVNAQDEMLNSPFLYAGASGYVEILRLCLENGASFTVFNRYGGSALIPAAEKRHVDVVKILTKTPNFPINHINKLGWTALLEAIILGSQGQKQIEIVRILVDAGCDYTIADFDGITPLQHAKNNSMDDIVRILINAGAAK